MLKKTPMKKRLLLFLTGILSIITLNAQIHEPTSWTHEIKIKDAKSAEIIHKVNLEGNWHLYGMNIPENGPIPTSIEYTKVQGAVLDGKVSSKSKLIEQFDSNFDMKLSWYSHEAIFVQKLKLTGGPVVVEGEIRFMVCNDEMCLPPTSEEFSLKAKGSGIATQTSQQNVAADTKSETVPTVEVSEFSQTDSALTVATPVKVSDEALWTPVIDELKNFGKSAGESGNASLWFIFFAGLIGGFLALFTPCVWPIIPMTVSFFLKRSSNKAKGKADAILYGFSIIIIYVLLGILITTVFGASALNSMSTNAIFNLIFFGLLVVFAISFFGAFEITLPSSWSTKLDAKAESTAGFLSILLMAFTLVLVSFSCTGPIIGTLLVEVSQTGSILAPAIGMLGFATALALPFTFFAFFPSLLKELPKSGGWLNKVKVILAFLELALALKFLSVADLAYGWRILDREVFVSLWIIIFALLGFYLLGKLKFSHDSESKHTSVSGVLMAIVSFAFAIYMVPGLWGAPLKAVSAFTPPLSTQDFNLFDDEVHAKFTDFESGMKYAAEKNLPVVIDFTGFGCVNCRKMEAAVWTDPTVKDKLENDFVLISLFVDDKTPLIKPYTIEENGKTRKIKTIGDKWSFLQRSKFGANAQPFYVMLDVSGKPLNTSYAFDEDPEKFINWLNVR